MSSNEHWKMFEKPNILVDVVEEMALLDLQNLRGVIVSIKVCKFVSMGLGAFI